MSATVQLRPGERLDWRLVLDSFACEYGKTSQGKRLGGTMALRRAMAALLTSPRWMLTVAAPIQAEPTPDGSDEIYAWMVWGGTDVAWLHVKDFWRGYGFARALLGERHGEIGCAFLPSEESRDRAGKAGIIIRYRPHLLLRELLNGP